MRELFGVAMLVSKRYLLIFSILMIIVGISVCVYGYLAKPITTIRLESAELVYVPGSNPSIKYLPVPQYNVVHLEFSSNYSMTIYVHFQGVTHKLASNVTYLDIRFTMAELGATKRWVLTDFTFEPSRTPCAMRFNLTYERPYPQLGRYFSALGVWFLALGIGPHGYLWINKKLKEDVACLIFKLTLILSYFWTFVFIYYVFLGLDPLPEEPFRVTPFMLGLMLPLAIFAMATIVVFGVILAYYLLAYGSFSVKLGFLFLFGSPLLLALIYLARPRVSIQTEIPIALFVASYGVLYVLQARSEQMGSKPWLLPFSLGWVFMFTIYSPIHELGHFLVADFDEATVRGVTWWWITESGIHKPNIFIDPESFSSIYAYVLCRLAGLLIILVPFSVLLLIWRFKRSDWWHFSFILIASSFVFSFDDFYRIGFVVQGPLLAACLAAASVSAAGSLFFWYFYKKLPSIMHAHAEEDLGMRRALRRMEPNKKT